MAIWARSNYARGIPYRHHSSLGSVHLGVGAGCRFGGGDCRGRAFERALWAAAAGGAGDMLCRAKRALKTLGAHPINMVHGHQMG